MDNIILAIVINLLISFFIIKYAVQSALKKELSDISYYLKILAKKNNTDSNIITNKKDRFKLCENYQKELLVKKSNGVISDAEYNNLLEEKIKELELN